MIMVLPLLVKFFLSLVCLARLVIYAASKLEPSCKDAIKETFMKTRTTTTLIMLAGLSLNLSLMAQAQGQDDLLFATDSVLNSPQLDIDGYYEEKPKESPADRMAKTRRKLEERNEQMVQKKIEDIRIREEQKLARQLNQAFTDGFNNMDQVQTTQAAPVAPIVVEAPAPTPVVIENTNKILPFFGVTNIRGERIDFESKINMGLTFENLVTDSLSVGVGIGYTQMDIKDYSNQFVNGFSNPLFNPGYFQSFGQGRNIDYKNLQMLVNSKLFLTKRSKIRPFIGGALNYNRSKLQYTDNGNNFNLNSVQFGNEGYSTSYVGATGMIGSEVSFTDQIGMSLDFRYTRGLTSGFNSKAEADPFQNPDQLRLQNIGTEIESADFFSLNIGVVVSF